MTFFIVLKFLSLLIFPPASLAVAVVLWLPLRWARWHRLANVILFLGVAETLIFSLPFVSNALMAPLENEARAAARSTPRCCFDAIVILGGAVGPAEKVDGRPTLLETSDRIWEGAQLWHDKVAPRIILSGGSVSRELGRAAMSEAEAMRIFLVALGVPADAIVLEEHSINTIENLHEVHRLVGDQRVALVTSAYHMPRALAIAQREGLVVSPFPANFRAGVTEGDFFWESWLPDIFSMATSTLAVRERLALAFDWRRGGRDR